MQKSQSENIRILCLGAGQEVGRSCICVTLRDVTIMFDVGIHMLYSDSRRYPDFSMLCESKDSINEAVDLVVLTHFHLDHCGALPYLTEKFGYRGPIVCSSPTKALLPIMLQDYRKVISDKKEEQFYLFGSGEVKSSTEKVQSIGLFETASFRGIKVTSYYAGHVLGACMFNVEYEGLSVVYTGDYNSYADRHLGSACAPRLRPNILITETTYSTTIRETKRDRERSMLKIITETIQNKGRVLIPVFALGRAQELAVLLETYWKRTESTVPIYFSAGLIEKANLFYRLFVDWLNEKIQDSFSQGDNVFEFKKVKPFDKNLIKADTPYVLFATPGMLHSGTSVQVFKEWCEDPRNTLIIPGYCVEGTLGNRLLNGAKEVTLDKKTYSVKMRVENVSFSAHADAKGIINLLRNVEPEEIIFVHGDKTKMAHFKPLVEEQLSKKVHMPPNHTPLYINASSAKKMRIDLFNPPKQKGNLLFQLDGSTLLLKQRNMAQELNQVLFLLGQKSVVVKNQVKCLLQSPQLSSSEKQSLQKKQNSCLTKLSIKNEHDSPEKIQGSLDQLLSFLRVKNDF